MNKRYLAIIVFFLLFLFAYSHPENPKKQANYYCKDCNVIIILVDALRADHLGCYGYERNTSPNIDKLARESMFFKNAFAQSSWTRPGTASILTGLYPKNHGANTRNDTLSEDVLMISEILKKEGYNTYGFVQNPNAGKAVGFNQGYDIFREGFKPEVKAPAARSDNMNKGIMKTLDDLNPNSKNLIYIHYIDPHSPYLPGQILFSKNNSIKFDEDYMTNVRLFNITDSEIPTVILQMIDAYDDEIRFNDKMIGLLFKFLKEKNIYDKSIIIIVSDHGEEFYEHNDFQHGNTLYDESIKVPLIIAAPGINPEIITKQANQVDIVPTILDILGLKSKNNFDGNSLMDSFDKLVFSELDLDNRKLVSIRTPEEKLILDHETYETEGALKWFKKQALIEFESEKIEIGIFPAREKTTIQILDDGEEILRTELKREIKKISYNFSSTKKRNISIESMTPCSIPKKMGLGNDLRCLSFCIYNSSNFDIEHVYGTESLFFLLDEDSKELNNVYYDERFINLSSDLKKKLDKYLSTRAILNKTELKYDKETLEQLKALGYLG